mmetsp:Transcript_39505/g.125330  ORF Transcript_39505/g.125330 Transcript_39505/m.125330 type:complete len:109 (+) Transcript_39505:37-363(+)
MEADVYDMRQVAASYSDLEDQTVQVKMVETVRMLHVWVGKGRAVIAHPSVQDWQGIDDEGKDADKIALEDAERKDTNCDDERGTQQQTVEVLREGQDTDYIDQAVRMR